jgi:hypothetical protein
VFCIVYNACRELLTVLAAFSLIMTVMNLVAALLVGLASCIFCCSFLIVDAIQQPVLTNICCYY